MILGDSSVWVDHLRGRRNRGATRLYELLGSDELVTTDVVVMEVLAGARDEHDRGRLERLLATFGRIPVEADDYESAAAIYRACRRRGYSPRSMLDCLIAAVAIRVDAAVLHHDRDFDAIAQHVPLTLDR